MTALQFGQGGFPRRIESDPTFNGWSASLPRLWYLDQRQATRLDAESLFGASQFAIFYGRAVFTTIADPVQVGAVGIRGYFREQVTDIGQPIQNPDRVVSYHVTIITVLPAVVQTVVLSKRGGGPVAPIVHPDLGANPR